MSLCQGYYYEGFLAVQRAVDLSITQELTGDTGIASANNVSLQLKSFPYPPYLEDLFLFVLTTQFPFLVMLCFIVIAPIICKEIVMEKEKKLKVCWNLLRVSLVNCQVFIGRLYIL